MHFYFCIFIFNVSHSLHLSSYSFIIVLICVAYCVYIVAFIIILCIDLFSCKAASLFTMNLLTYLLTYLLKVSKAQHTF